MKTQHTPGKWKLRESELDIKGGTWVVEQDNGDRRGLYLGTVDRTIPAGEANARLIAAAPDLLEALQCLLVDYGSAMPDGTEKQNLICTLPDVDGAKGRAFLIEAAPQLLEALKVAVQVMKDNDLDEALAGEFCQFEDAIDRATGGEQ